MSSSLVRPDALYNVTKEHQRNRRVEELFRQQTSATDEAKAALQAEIESHNHNDLYYTEAEVNVLLAGKVDVGSSGLTQSQVLIRTLGS